MSSSDREPTGGTEHTDAVRSRSAAERWALAGLLLVLLLSGFSRLRLLEGSSPYVLHEDELIATRRAARMLETGDFDPRFFRYPSLTIYLAAASFGVAHLVQGEAPSTENGELEPFYERPEIGLAPRVLLVLLSLATMAMLGDLARRAFGRPVLLVLAPLLLALSPRYLMMSWTYVNVDLVGAFVCTSLLWFLFRTRERDSLLTRAVVPGLLTGLAVGSKYYLGLVGLPAACVILGRGRARWRSAVPLVVLFTVVGFVLSTPYSVVDVEHFVEQVMVEVNHYSEGHRGAEAEPGLEQLAYYLGRTRNEFGWGPCVLALVGIAAGLRRRPAETGLLLAFPLALLLFLSTQRVHFIRNFLSGYALFPAFAAYGGVVLWDLARRLVPGPRGPAGAVTALVLAAACLAAMPSSRIRKEHTAPSDSRNRAVEWILAHAEPDAPVFVADELQVDVRALEARTSVVVAPTAELAVGEHGRGGRRAVWLLPEVEPGSKLDKHFGAVTMRGVRRLSKEFRAGTSPIPREAKRLLHLGNPAVEVRTGRLP